MSNGRKPTRIADLDEWTVTDLDELFMEAAEVERMLPAVRRRQKMGSWPEYVEEWSAYGWTDAEPSRPRPSVDQVTRHGLALDIGLLAPRDDRWLIWAVAASAAYRERGPNFARIGRKLGVSRPTAKSRYETALIRLAMILRDHRRAERRRARMEGRKAC